MELVGGQRADAVPLRPQRMEVDSLDHRRVACRSQPRLGKRRLGGGQQGDDHVRAALHGQRLARLATPQLAGSLTAVDARSPIDAWAVGSAGTATLAEHWDGTNWSVVPTPAPSRPGRAARGRHRRYVRCLGGGRLHRSQRVRPQPHPPDRALGRQHKDKCATDITRGYSDGSRTTSCVTSTSPGSVPEWSATSRPITSNPAIVKRWNGTSWSNLSVPCISARAATAPTGRWPPSRLSAPRHLGVRRCWDEFQHSIFSEATALHFASGAWSWISLPGPDNQQAVYGSTTIPGTRGCGRSARAASSTSNGRPLVGRPLIVEFGP